MIDAKLVEQFAKDEADKAIDNDLMGNPITSADVLLMGAFGPLVMRIAEKAAAHGAEQERARLAAGVELEAVEVQMKINNGDWRKVDGGQPRTDYLLREYPNAYKARHLVTLQSAKDAVAAERVKCIAAVDALHSITAVNGAPTHLDAFHAAINQAVKELKSMK